MAWTDNMISVERLKPLVRGILKIVFRVETQGLEHWPHGERRLLIVANHVSFLDGVLMSAFLPEIPVFVINTRMAARWWVKPFIALTRHITIDPTNPLYLKLLIHHLKDGERVAIFPEGRITVTGALMKIYEGPAVAADRAGAVLLPVHLEGPQYSLFSRLGGVVRRQLLPRIRLTVHPPQRLNPPTGLSGRARRRWLGNRLEGLMAELVFQSFPADRSLFEALLEARDRHGSGQVIVQDMERKPLSYRQLLLRCLVLEQLLERRGGAYVGLLLPGSVAAVAGFVALHLQNRVPVMLNFTVGVAGLISACRTAEVEQVLTARAFAVAAGLEGTLAQLAEVVEVVYLEDLKPLATPTVKLRGLLRAWRPRSSYRRLAGPVGPDDPAVVLFTSGSEGAPKGVVLSHRNLLSNYAQIQATLDISPRDKCLSTLPLFHSFGLTTCTLVPLLAGIRVFLYPSPLHYHVIPELAYEQRATIMFGTNTFLMGYGRAADPYDFFDLRLAVAGGEALRPETRRLWAEKFGIRLIEGYGVTEASPVLAANSPKHHRAGSVGRLMPGVEHYLAPVEGIAQGGRLCVRGANIMRGYLFHDRPGELQPPATEQGPGWYDTGDIVAIDADGYVTILGRAKRFAKIGGEMVSLATVEGLAAELWPQEQHAAASLPDPVKGERIVLLTTRQDADRKDLVRGAQAVGLGEIFVPRQVRVVNALPLLGSGKLDYAALGMLAKENN